MSFPYGQFSGSGDNYSTPSTPHDSAFPQWESIEGEQQQEIIQQQQSQEQQQQQQQQLELHSPIPGSFPQTIQLEQQPPIVPSQAHDDTPVHLHPVQQDTSAQAGGGSMIMRSGRSRQPHQQAHHPYQRRGQSSTSAAAASVRQQQQMQVFPVQPQVISREHHVHFAAPPPMVRQSSGGIVASAVPSTSSARHSPLVPSPTSRLTSFSSSLSNSPAAPPGSTLLRTSPRTMDPPALPNPQAGPSATRQKGYIIRMDTHYDPDTHLLTAVMEVPGVKREHLSVRLSTCPYNRVRQITVSGAVYPPFSVVPPLINPAAAAAHELSSNVSVRERKYGPCQRVLPVPSDLKREDIEAHLQDGVLVLRFPCGAPAEEDGEDVAVR